MFVVAALLVVLAVVALVAGLATGVTWVLWTAVGISGAAALALVAHNLRQRQHGGALPGVARAEAAEDPPSEQIEVGDLLLVLDRSDQVLVVDEQPRYHLAGCTETTGGTTLPLSRDEARQEGFTACGVCRPDRHIAERVREDAGE